MTENKSINVLRKSYYTGKTKSYEYRISQLKAMNKLLDENEEEICLALYKDLHKQKYDVVCTTIMVIRNELICAIESLRNWMQPEYVTKSWVQSVNTAYVKKEPLGLMLIISSWNYPIQLTLIPLIGAIAAGNAVVLKPSPDSPASCSLLSTLIPKYMDTSCYAVIQGGPEQVAELLKDIKFDHIMFTGSSETGKVIMKAAAEYLTPVTLELGGKNPAIVLPDFDIRIAARRIVWGKFANCGQTCLAPDYVLCPEQLTERFVSEAIQVIEEFYGKDSKTSDSYGRIINARHFERLQGLLKDREIIYGGKTDPANLYIGPTIVKVNIDDVLLKDEIFGPILPIVDQIPVCDMTNFINNTSFENLSQLSKKPLAIYLFTNDKVAQDKFLHDTTSGGMCINDVMMQYTYENLPFGGVGDSGMGRYHGKYSFDQFSHHKACLICPSWTERMLELRNPPYTLKKSQWLTWFLGKKLRTS